jgi:hypothetical protein
MRQCLYLFTHGRHSLRKEFLESCTYRSVLHTNGAEKISCLTADQPPIQSAGVVYSNPGVMEIVLDHQTEGENICKE